MGMGLAIYVPWVIESGLGAMFGKLIPDTHALGIDFLLPIYFLGLVMGFRKRPMWLPVVVVSAIASVIAYRTIGSPWHVSIGAAAGILLAAAMPVRPGKLEVAPGVARGCRPMSTTLWIILWSAVATYLTRIGGHLVLSRFERVHPRVEAGLNAVPAAVLTTLVAPAAVSAGPAELLALVRCRDRVAARGPAGDVPDRRSRADRRAAVHRLTGWRQSVSPWRRAAAARSPFPARPEPRRRPSARSRATRAHDTRRASATRRG